MNIDDVRSEQLLVEESFPAVQLGALELLVAVVGPILVSVQVTHSEIKVKLGYVR